MFTIFATLECSNISIHSTKLNTKLKTSNINRGEIIKYYKANYDPMLELHNSFFDKCLNHLSQQDILKEGSFFMQSTQHVKDLFSKGIVYEPLVVKELGITIKCEDYISQVISEDYIQKKKEDLKFVKTNLFNTNKNNNFKGRAGSENSSGRNEDVKITVNGKKMSVAEYRGALQKDHMAQSNIDKLVSDAIAQASSGGSTGRATGASRSGKSSGASTTTSAQTSNTASSISSSSQASSNSSQSIQTNGNLSAAEFEKVLRQKGITGATLQKIMDQFNAAQGGSSGNSNSSSNGIHTYTFDSNGGNLQIAADGSFQGDQGSSDRSTSYLGSTTSGMGAKFSIFYDRKITQKDGKSYVTIGGVQHLIDGDGWIHGLNIDSTDKNINYNIAYENYFDTSCESMLTFMKNKYTQLLADYNMNKDYVHNLQIENRRNIVKFETCTKEQTITKLSLNTCEQKIQDERVKKSTLYHNIKDIKTIKVDTRIKDMEITINKLEVTINNYKIEIINLKKIIINNKKECDGWLKDCGSKQEEKCKSITVKIINNCAKEKETLNQKIINLNIQIQTLNINLHKCKSRIDICDKDAIYKKLKKCEADNYDLTRINVEINKKILIIRKNIYECDKKVKKFEVDIKIHITNINKCKIDLDACLKDGGKKECDKRITIINNQHTTIINNWTSKYERCEKDNFDCNDNKRNYLQCKQDLLEITTKINIKCDKEKLEIKNKCDDDKDQLHREIQVKIVEIKKITIDLNNCKDKEQSCAVDLGKCRTDISISIKTCQDKCKKDADQASDNCVAQINIEIARWKTCRKDMIQAEEDSKKNCDESKTTIVNNITTITKQYQDCQAKIVQHTTEIDSLNISIKQITNNYNICKSTEIDYKTTIEICKRDKKVEIEKCNNWTIDINAKLKICQNQLESSQSDYKSIYAKWTSLTINYNSCKGDLGKKDSECDTKITNITINIRKEETKKCEESLSEINIKIKNVIKSYEICSGDLKICDTTNIKNKEYLKYLTLYLSLKNVNENQELKITDLTGRISKLEINITNLNVSLAECKKNYGDCQTSIINSTLKIELNTCTNKLTRLQKIAERYDVYITSLQLKYSNTINELTSFYESRIIKLTIIINGLKDTINSQNGSSVSISITINKNSEEIKQNNNEITGLRHRIKVLIEQKKDWLMKIDTIDCTSISMISEYKSKVVILQNEIEEYYGQILTLTGYIRITTEENARLQAQVDGFKSTSEYYQELINKYSEVNSDQSEYIKRLQEMIKEYQLKDENGNAITVKFWIENSNSETIIKELRVQITDINIKIKDQEKKCNKDRNDLKIIYDKQIGECKNEITINVNKLAEAEENCQIRIEKMVKKIKYEHQQAITTIRYTYTQQLNECKKRCTVNPIIPNDETYNFDIYMKHCHILIEKNTANDCKSIGDIRTYYNEKCIMTSLPGSTKDLTTFASSDFTDDRNALMMKRLNSKN